MPYTALQLRGINKSFSLLEQTGDGQKRDADHDRAKPPGGGGAAAGQCSASAEEEGSELGQRKAQPAPG